MANHLISEKSPYLLQHAHNPVDWYPWGEEAFEKARAEDKPIFLSVGYSTCHWCHVMERESFENEELARDSESLVRAGQGGSRRAARRGPHLHDLRAGVHRRRRLADVGVADAGPEAVLRRHVFSARQSLRAAGIRRRSGADRRSLAERSARIMRIQRRRGRAAGAIRGRCRAIHRHAGARRSLDSAFQHFRRMFDSAHGGFGSAPKFPRPVVFNFLLRYYARIDADQEALDMTLDTLRAMANGGMHDQLGGGFHRYSVDERWFVPHFEKMLYDQAQLAVSYLEAFQITRDPFYAKIARSTLDYVLRDMTHPDGGFYSAEDADSVIDPANPKEKGEGAFYIWSSGRS